MAANLLKQLIVGILLLCAVTPAKAYSVLTHEAIIDAVWDKVLLPELKAKYPGMGDSAIREAHAYAYGGAVAPDMGYFPFGSKLFTNLIHYVRSGDFTQTLLQEATNVYEYAFALGVLAHYNADNYGHPIGTNRSAPLLFSKVREKYGDTVTYADDPVSHVRTEFSFDVVQTARGHYASKAYRDFIGFKVADSAMARAFKKIYGLNMYEVFSNFRRSLNTFRWSVKELFPILTRTAWASKKSQIRKSQEHVSRRSYVYRLSRKDYIHDYGNDRDKPGFGTTAFSVIVRILPKVGPFKKLKIIVPGPEAEKLFLNSFDTTVVHYIASISKLNGGKVVLPNKDFDTGKETAAGEYALADESYSDLLLKLHEADFKTVTPALRQNIIHFYEYSRTHQKKAPEYKPEVTAALTALKARQ